MARTSSRQELVRHGEVPANLVSVKVGFWRRQFAELLEVKAIGFLRRGLRF